MLKPRFMLITVALLVGLAPDVGAQIPLLDKIFANVSDVNVYALSATPTGPRGPIGEDRGGLLGMGLGGFGVEVSFDVGGFLAHARTCDRGALLERLEESSGAARDRAVRDVTRCQEDRALLAGDRCDPGNLLNALTSTDQAQVREAQALVERCEEARERRASPDTVATLTAIKTELGPRGDTIKVIREMTAKVNRPEASYGGNIELALGFAQIGGFRSVSPSRDIRGSIQELPYLAAYVTFMTESVVSPYLGIKSGLTQLSDWRARVASSSDTTSDLIFKAAGTTYLLGASAGAVVDIFGAHVFLEASYTMRRFSGVDWSGAGTIPGVLPHSLALDSVALLFGAQVGIGTK